MATQVSGQSGRSGFEPGEMLNVDLLLKYYDSEMAEKKKLEIPSLQPSLPIIRPPEGCEYLKPTKFKNFPYEHLPTPTSIRILKVMPGRDSYSSFELFRPPIRCSVVIVDLNDNPSYDALSYTWGDPCTLYLNPKEISPSAAWASRPFDIEIDGKAVSVGANLYAALLMLRSHITHQKDPQFKDTPQSTGYFWIDALCINQKDLKEKSSQVMMMSRIYQQAHLVLAWLGGGDPLSRQAIHDLATIASLKSNNQLNMKELRSLDISAEETYEKLKIRKLNYSSWIGMYLFVNRAWFKRAWIVQEITLARDPWFVCGKQICNLEAILTALEVLQQSRWYNQMRNLAEPLIQNHLNEYDYRSRLTLATSQVRLYRPRQTHLVNSNLGGIIRDIRISMGTFKGFAKDGSAPKRPKLLRLLELYRFTESGDTRDKIYAFVGLSLEQEIKPLKVDYELKEELVFVQATQHVLASMGNLDILSTKKGAHGIESTLKLPSWVPDYTVQDFAPPINQHSLFSASRGLGDLRLSYLPGNKLQLWGVKINTIKDVAVRFKWAAIAELPPLLEKVVPPSGQTRFEALWRTLLLDQYEEKTPAPKGCGKLFLEVLEQTVLGLQVTAAFSLRYAETLAKFRTESAKSTEDISKDLDRSMTFEQARDWVGRMYTAVQHILERHSLEDGIIFPPEFVEFENQRRKCKTKAEHDGIVEIFHDKWSVRSRLNNAGGDIPFQVSDGKRLLFLTEDGTLGVSRAGIEPRDEVWALAGGEVPFILRPTGLLDAEFHLVGEAYVHGAMQGEAVAKVGGDNIRTVCLV